MSTTTRDADGRSASAAGAGERRAMLPADNVVVVELGTASAAGLVLHTTSSDVKLQSISITQYNGCNDLFLGNVGQPVVRGVFSKTFLELQELYFDNKQEAQLQRSRAMLRVCQ